MNMPLYKKIIIITCIVTIGSMAFPPRPAHALFPDWVNATIQVVGHGIQGALLGIDSAANTIQTGLDTVRNVVNGLPIEYGPVRQGLSIAMSSCDLLGGNISALSEIDALTSPSSPSYDPKVPKGMIKLPSGPAITTPKLTPASTTKSTGAVKGESTTVGGAIGKIYQDKIKVENSTIAGKDTQVLSTPIITSQTNLDPLANELITIGDKTKTNLTLALTKKLGLLRYQKTCYKVLDSSLKNSLIIASWNDQLKQAYNDTLKDLETRSAALNRNVSDMETVLTQAQHDVYKAIAASVAADINEQRTMDTVAQLKPKLTVGNYNQTVDALTKQVYAPKAIKEKYASDPSTQFILNSLLNAEIATDKYAKQQANQSAEAAALTALKASGQCAEVYDYMEYSQESIDLASSSMQPGCDVTQVMDSYRSKFSEIMFESKKAAELELANGGGFMSTRVCKPADQNAAHEIMHAAELSKIAKESSLTRKQYELKGQMRDPKYVEAINAEKTAMKNLQEASAVSTGGVEELCGSIDDAGGFTKNVMEQYIAQWIKGDEGTADANVNLEIQHKDTLGTKLFGHMLLNSTEPRSVVSLLSKDGKDFLKAILTGGTNSASTSSVSDRTRVLGEVTTTPNTSPVPVLPYMSPRGDSYINIRGE